MKYLIILTLFLFTCCSRDEEAISNDLLDISGSFTISEFENVKTYILQNGDKQTYRSFDGNNPHFSFSGFEAYLNAETGQKNAMNDPLLSDFNEITMRDSSADPQYYTIHVVRVGDSKKKDVVIQEGMKEGRVYLLNPYKDDIKEMEINVEKYTEVILNTISAH